MAVGVYAVSFGVLAVSAGLTPAQACVMSMLVFTGASQFAFVGVLAAGGGALAAMGPAVVLALRNAVYGLSLAPILPARLRDRALAAHLVIDETTAMARAEDDPARRGARSSPPASACGCAGTPARSPARCSAAGSATRARSGWTRCSRPRSSRCWRPQLRRPGAPVGRARRRADRASRCVPFAPAGVPILAALAGVVPGVLVARRRAHA